MKVGIDPTGGTDWNSGNIVWSSEFNALDIYTNIAAEAQAQGTRVTVFTYTTFLWPAPVNNVYWDDASLVVIGEGSPNPTSENNTPTSSNNNNPPPPPASGPGSIAAQPPNADGSQHHIVKTGETLGGIAVTYGVTSQTLRDLNGINGDTIFVGQDLLIKEPSAPPTPEVTPTVESTPEPTAVAEVPQTGEICLALFDDANQDGLRDAAEPLLANGLLNLAGAATNAHTTDGISEPFCFSDLPAGDYIITASAPAGYLLTSLPEIPVTISGGSEVSLSFGASTLPAATEEAPGSTQAQPRSILLIVGGVLGVLIILAGGGLAVYFLVYKRQAAKIE
jgi:LysM repeat protein